MPKGRPVRLRLFDFFNAIHGAETALREKSFEDYQASFVLQLAIERLLEVISEAVRYVPEDMRAKAPEIPWVAIEMLGNKTRHEYQSISARRIWRIAVEDIPPLKSVVQNFYAEAKRPADPWPDGAPK